MKKLTIRDVAKYCNVSATTVSLVLNGKTKEISDETVNTVRKAARELGYARNEVARSLATNKTETIAFIIPDITNLFYATIIKAANEEAIKYGYSILLCNTNNSAKLEHSQIQLLDNRQIDGIVVASRNAEKLLADFENKRNVPIVIIDEEVTELPSNVFSVTTDNESSGYNIAKYIIELGHTNIFVLEGLKDSTNNTLRKNGVIKALKEEQIPLENCVFVNGDYNMKKAHDLVKNNFTSSKTAIIAFNDLMAYGAIEAINEIGCNVPNDVSVVGFDGGANAGLVSDLASIKLTAINQNEELIGEIAMKLLLDHIKGKKYNKQTYFLPAEINYGNTVSSVEKITF